MHFGSAAAVKRTTVDSGLLGGEADAGFVVFTSWCNPLTQQLGPRLLGLDRVKHPVRGVGILAA